MKYNFSVFVALFIYVSLLKAQTTNDAVLFRVNDAPVYTSEFLRLYNKNNNLVQDQTENSVDNYLNLLINYKLKLEEAKALGLDNNPKYKQELAGYKKQLAKNYMPNLPITDTLLKEAYHRISNDIKASHILILLTEHASPEDTLQAYKSITEYRNRALNEGFENLRTQVHNGNTIFGEDLGWFSGFKMVYPFENQAYNTPVGSISKPFKTRFGYHIVYVQDKRKSRGERTVAHIMITNKDKEQNTLKADEQIQDIYTKLQQGEDFGALAKQFSEDSYTAPKAGMLPPFSGGQLGSQTFEDVAFGLDSIGDISKPFKTNFGWHIVKLYNIKPIGSFQELKPDLQERIKRDDRSKLINQALTQALKDKYNVNTIPENLTYFESIINNAYYNRAWQLPENFPAKTVLFRIKNKPYTYSDFGTFLVNEQNKAFDKKPLKTIVHDTYNSFLNTALINYQEEHLEDENQEYAHIVEEYRDGLLLFDLMEMKIWNVANTDTTALKAYYLNHKNQYITPEKADAIIATSPSKKTLQQVQKMLVQNDNVSTIKTTLNTNNKINVMFTEGLIDAKHQALPKHFKFKLGASKIYNHNKAYNLIFVRRVIPEKQQTFENAQGLISSDFQTQMEADMIKSLKNKYKVDINQSEFKHLKSELNKN